MRRVDAIWRLAGLLRHRCRCIAEYSDVVVGILYERYGDRRRRFDRAHKRVWDYESDTDRYRAVIASVSRLLGRDAQWGEALEVGSAQGVFTQMLAFHCEQIRALELSPYACARARERCLRQGNVTIEEFDIIKESVRGQYDIVFALDCLEAIHGRQTIEDAVSKLQAAVRPGGLLVFSGSRLPNHMRNDRWARRLIEGADSQLERIQARENLQLVSREFYPESESDWFTYRQHIVALFQKRFTGTVGAGCPARPGREC